ncbi:hypothetical protein DFJ74DRAFT_38827 [Hyaloraphidium curvatum]|nr:hypothetical protein DFJ74DRAFT_38827 [Hyaloraphidium curvatum]
MEENYTVALTVVTPSAVERPQIFERDFRLSADAVRLALAAKSVLPHLPEVGAWKAKAVDSRPWPCYMCSEPATAVASAPQLIPMPEDGLAKALGVLCVPHCTKGQCVSNVGKLLAMDTTVPSDVVCGIDVPVAISLWSYSGVEKVLREPFNIPVSQIKTRPKKATAVLGILHGLWRLRSDALGRVRDWHCIGCGRVSGAYHMSVAKGARGAPEKWLADVFPHCDDSDCRARAAAKALKHAGGDPVGTAEGSFCCADCDAITTDKGRGMQRCGRCKAVRYCSQECQRKDWPRHKAVCVPREAKGGE